MANLNPKRTKRCNQSSLVETLKGTTPRHRPSRYAAFGEISKRTTPRHRPSMYAAFGEISKRTTSRHRSSVLGPPSRGKELFPPRGYLRQSECSRRPGNAQGKSGGRLGRLSADQAGQRITFKDFFIF